MLRFTALVSRALYPTYHILYCTNDTNDQRRTLTVYDLAKAVLFSRRFSEIGPHLLFDEGNRKSQFRCQNPQVYVNLVVVVANESDILRLWWLMRAISIAMQYEICKTHGPPTHRISSKPRAPQSARPNFVTYW
jgi:hypothetical protein